MANGHSNVGPVERGVSVAAGVIALRGATRRGVPTALLLAGAGSYLLYRGLTGRCRVYRALGVGPSEVGTVVGLCSQMTVQRPASEVYEFLRDLRHLPEFSRRIERVDESVGGLWQVTVRLPFGRSLTLPVRTTVAMAASNLAWCTDAGASTSAALAVDLKQVGDACEVRVDGWFQAPPLPGRLLRGVEGSRPLRRAGLTPSKALEHELSRLRQLLEAGEVSTVRGQSAGAARAARVERRRRRMAEESVERASLTGGTETVG